MRAKKIVSVVLCLLLLLQPLSLYTAAAESSADPFVYHDAFDYSFFGDAVDFFGSGAWGTEYCISNSADDFGYRDSTQPVIANGKLIRKTHSCFLFHC